LLKLLRGLTLFKRDDQGDERVEESPFPVDYGLGGGIVSSLSGVWGEAEPFTVFCGTVKRILGHKNA